MKTFKEFLLEAEEKTKDVPKEPSLKDKMRENVFKTFDKLLGPAKPYLEKNKATLLRGTFLLRGMDPIETNNGIDQLYTRQDRYPRDTDVDIHNKVGAWFKEKFGVNYRVPVVFCRQTKEDFENYGEPHIVLPCGVHKFCFSPKVFDLTLYVDPAMDHKAHQRLLLFCSSGKRKYLPVRTLPNFEYDLGDVLFGLFLNLYWTFNEKQFNDLNENYTLDQLERLFSQNGAKFYNDSLAEFMSYIENLMIKSKTSQSCMSVLLATLGYKSIDHFKETMVRIGNGYMNSLGYKETEDQTTVRPLRNEIMVYCKSFIVVPFVFNNLLMEYVREKF